MQINAYQFNNLLKKFQDVEFSIKVNMALFTYGLKMHKFWVQFLELLFQFEWKKIFNKLFRAPAFYTYQFY